MTNDLFLLKDRHVILRILRRLVAIRTATRLLHEILGSVEVGLIARYLIEFAEGHLDDGMTARTVDLSLVRTEGLTYQIGILDGHVQEVLFASSTIMGHGTLDEVT